MAKRAGPGEAETLQYLDSERVRLDGGIHGESRRSSARVESAYCAVSYVANAKAVHFLRTHLQAVHAHVFHLTKTKSISVPVLAVRRETSVELQLELEVHPAQDLDHRARSLAGLPS